MHEYNERIVAAFSGRLVRASVEAVGELRIPDADKEYLVDVGLPEMPGLLFMPKLSEASFPAMAVETLWPVIETNGPWTLRRIAIEGDAGWQMWLVESEEKPHVLSMFPHEKYQNRIVNTSVRLFGISLMLYEETLLKRDAASNEDEFVRFGHVLENELRELDPGAFVFDESEQRSWWMLVTEQMKDGVY